MALTLTLTLTPIMPTTFALDIHNPNPAVRYPTVTLPLTFSFCRSVLSILSLSEAA